MSVSVVEPSWQSAWAESADWETSAPQYTDEEGWCFRAIMAVSADLGTVALQYT